MYEFLEHCAYNVLFCVESNAVAVVYPETAVPVNDPSVFNTLLPPEAAVYHPLNVYPLVTVNAVHEVVLPPVLAVYKLVSPLYAYFAPVVVIVPQLFAFGV